MALIKCIECGNAVSTAAQMCPKCGAPVTTSITSREGIGALEPYMPFWGPPRIVGAVSCVLGAVALFFAMLHVNSLESLLYRANSRVDPLLHLPILLGVTLLIFGIPPLAGIVKSLKGTIGVAIVVAVPYLIAAAMYFVMP